MAHTPGRLVIRTYEPLRRWLLLGGSLLLGALSLYVAFEAGRGTAGSAGRQAAAAHEGLLARIAALESGNRELRLKLASQETTQVGHARERAEVARTIGELQAQIARQAQDLAFYRGIAGDAAAAPPVRIQQFRMTSLGAPGRYALRLVLGRPVRPEDVVSGTLALTVEGTRNDMPATLDLGEVTGAALQLPLPPDLRTGDRAAGGFPAGAHHRGGARGAQGCRPHPADLPVEPGGELMFKREKSAAPVETLIGPTVTIRGDVQFSGGLHLQGRVCGNVSVQEGGEEAALELVEGAVVEGEVRAGHAVLNGQVRGDVYVTGRLQLGPKAVIEGNVQYGSIEMALGARITGKMLSRAAQAAGPSGVQSLESKPSNTSVQ
jgi:cytoskeletal protein CcmA (bactofilin family)